MDDDDLYTDPLIDREREEPDKLSRQQVNQALMEIEDLHPLRDKARLGHVLPCLSPCLRFVKVKPNFRHALRMSIMSAMNMKVSVSE